MSNIHFILQGKGGVGKSVTAALIAQNFKDSEGGLALFDTDPVNSTFANYKGLDVKACDIMEKGNINPARFDNLMESLIESEAQTIVIDNGAATFVPLLNYLDTNDAFSVLAETGNTVYIHTLVTAGQGMMDTLAGLKQLCENFGESDAKIVVWKNEFWGDIEMNGKSFEQSKVFIDNKKVIDTVITIPMMLPKETFQDTFSKLLKLKMTFEEGIASDSFTIMERQRLKRIQKDLFSNINQALDI